MPKTFASDIDGLCCWCKGLLPHYAIEKTAVLLLSVLAGFPKHRIAYSMHMKPTLLS